MISESIAVIDGYAPVPGNDFGAGEEYNSIQEKGFLSVREYPLSTFSADVDTASYSNIRRMINRGEEIPEDAVRMNSPRVRNRWRRRRSCPTVRGMRTASCFF